MSKAPTMPMAKRMLAFLAVIVCTFVGLAGRLFYLQIIKGEEYREIAIAQQTGDIAISAKRGTIYDRNYKALAVSATAYKVIVSPLAVSDETDRAIILNELPVILGIDREKLDEILDKNTQYYVLARRIEEETADAVREFVTEYGLESCFSIYEDPKRYYPYGDFASHILGFVGSDNQGLEGLEALYDEYLTGEDGRIITTKNGGGGILSVDEYEKYIEAQDGYSLVLTIDETIQHYLEKRLETACTDNLCASYAAGIVMDVKTGAVLGMAIEPDYDVNTPFEITDRLILDRLTGLEGDEYTEQYALARENMWKNVTVTDQYEPGSTFKIITSSMAVEEKVVDENTTFYCNGYRDIAGTIIHCANTRGHGYEDFQLALCNSCNPAFMDIGALIGVHNFVKYVTGFGFLERTGIDLPGEGTGIFHREENMGPVELATSAFGQTFKVTPIQLITAVCAVANGGNMMQPYVVGSIVDSDMNVIESFEPTVTKQPISETTADTIVSMLETVVAEGGGRNAYVKGFRVCGKSGTSQKIDEVKEDGTYEHTASFIAFAPADDPQVAVLVILDEPQVTPFYGATIAGPVASNLLEEILTYLDVTPQYTEEELVQQDVTVGSYTGMDSDEAKQALSSEGLRVRIIGGQGTVEQQIPAAGQSLPYTGTVLLYTNGVEPEQEIVVPDLIGMGASAANAELNNLGLNIKIVGKDPYDSGVVAVSQSIDPGTAVSAGTVITVEFRSKTTTDD